MTVKEVICAALRLAGRDDAAEAIDGGGALTAECQRTKNAFLAYFNSVLDELARAYFPLGYEQEVSFAGGRKPLSSFPRRVIRVKKVAVDGKPVAWSISSGYLCAEAESAVVFYEYAPNALGEDDTFNYPVYAVGEKLVEFGMVAEHYLVLGCAEESRMWEEKYRQEIDALLCRRTVRNRIPPRRWV